MTRERAVLKYIYLGVVLLLFFAAWRFYDDVFAANVSLKKGQTDHIYVHTGESYDMFINRIEGSQLVQNADGFRRLSRLLNLDDRLKAGRYKIEGGMSNFDMIKLLKSGRQSTVNVTLKYANSLGEIAKTFSKYFESDSAHFMEVFMDTATQVKYELSHQTFISLFVPNTYNFYWNSKPEKVLEKLNAEYLKFWNKDRSTLAITKGLSPLEVCILASIVQKESNKADEMPNIASVYLNRIKVGMPLQADPTVIFAWNDYSIKRVTGLHTAINSPYNTYINKGLPPGPICMAGATAIDAVLHAANTKYLYFCAKEDFSGYHAFAETLNQHNNNAARYQRALNKLGVK